MQTTDLIFQLIILFFSVIVHEVAHGYAALFQGDNTAKYQNRLTLNPIRHIDIFGSIILPVMLYISHLPVFGWAKPVPFNPYNLRNQKWGEAIVAGAGPLINIIIAVAFGLALRFGVGSMSDPTIFILKMIVIINIMIAVFNLVPIPPLDGSKVLFSFLPLSAIGIRRFMEKYSMLLLLLFIFILWSYIFPVVIIVFTWITGISLL